MLIIKSLTQCWGGGGEGGGVEEYWHVTRELSGESFVLSMSWRTIFFWQTFLWTRSQHLILRYSTRLYTAWDGEARLCTRLYLWIVWKTRNPLQFTLIVFARAFSNRNHCTISVTILLKYPPFSCLYGRDLLLNRPPTGDVTPVLCVSGGAAKGTERCEGTKGSLTLWAGRRGRWKDRCWDDRSKRDMYNGIGQWSRERDRTL